MQESQIDTILGEDIQFRGRLDFKNSLKINGKFKGQITTAGHLIIGTSAHVDADIEASQVTVDGDLRGNIVANKRIDLNKAARMVGDIRTPDLRIESGSKYSGSCLME